MADPGFSKGGGANKRCYGSTLSILSAQKPSFMFQNLAKRGGAAPGAPYGKSATGYYSMWNCGCYSLLMAGVSGQSASLPYKWYKGWIISDKMNQINFFILILIIFLHIHSKDV